MPGPLLACEACFGKSDNADLAKAYTWGFAILIVFTFIILGGLTYAIFRLEKEKALRDEPA